MKKNRASFRDPRGHVYHVDGRVLRTVLPVAATDFEFVRSTGLIESLVSEKKLLPETPIDPIILKENHKDISFVLEHPKLSFISYPYEWTFSALKAAALLHLDIHLQALEHGVTLSDASAYNIQYQHGAPVFIDHLSFRRYQEGKLWQGHKQFCEQFLNPLLLQAYCEVPYNHWYRGALEGITAVELNHVLPLLRKFLPNVFMHIVMQASLQKVSVRQAQNTVKKIHLSLPALKSMLRGLRNWIEKLHIKNKTKTTWQDYSRQYSPSSQKIALVEGFVRNVQPSLLIDLGCNTGFYSKLALQAGAKQVIGFDADVGALEQAFAMAQSERLNFLPLYMDLANPSPAQGWQEAERFGFSRRVEANAVLALAVVHHLAIARNLPLDQLVEWLISLAPQGLLEFVPKQDPQLQKLLCLREDIFVDYTEENFLACVMRQAQIVKKEMVSENGRVIVWYKK